MRHLRIGWLLALGLCVCSITRHARAADDATGDWGGARSFLDRDEIFVELFCKLRFIPWLTFEPDAQVYFTPDGERLALGLRTKLKL